MKAIIASTLLAIIFLLSSGMGRKKMDIENFNSPLTSIRDQFIENLEEFEMSCNSLVKYSQSFADNLKNTNDLRYACSQARVRYKRVEYLLEYLQPEYVKKYINGAPLPKTDPTIPGIEIIPPCGLQTLDELVFSDEPELEASAILKLSKKLSADVRTTVRFLKAKNLEHRYILEAMREELVRIYTLGLTGFDTPGSGNAIPESQVALKSLVQALSEYSDFFDNREISLGKELLDILKAWSTYLEQHQDFDTLDRLYILKKYFNPLYAGFYDLQGEMNVEFRKEVDPTLQPVNEEVKTMFTADFLNPSYYSQISSKDLFDPKKIELGRLLFFDPALSKDLNMSCATCHQPQKGFADGKPKSIEREDLISRNAPGLINSVYYGHYFWDMREYDLERQVKHVMFNEDEFNMDFIDLADRLKQSSDYRALFQEAYGDRDKYLISTWSISNSLAAYVTSLRSWNSPFDQYARGDSEDLSDSAKRGFNLFMGKAACGTCHFAPSFSGIVPPRYEDSESEVLGVTTAFDTLHPVLDNDPGRARNKLPRDEVPHFHRSFKTMTVRNVELTAPYMHNGALDNLEDLMAFYNKGGGAGMGLEVEHQTLPADPLNLNDAEVKDIIHFMKSLTDTIGLSTAPVDFPAFETHPEWNHRGVAY